MNTRLFHLKVQSQQALLMRLTLIVAITATVAGCASIAERVGSDLVKKDIQSVEQEFKVFDTDLGLFRGCLTERGGSCQGDLTTALPQSSQHAAGQTVQPVALGASKTLADSVAKLPDDHSAKSGIALMNHAVVGQATRLHNHLRGHETGSAPGFSVSHGTGAHGGLESTATVTMNIGHMHHLHRSLLSSLGTTAWESLHGHCAALLAAHGDAPGRDALEADCRRVAFIRGYLEAYTRTGEFLEVDVELAGAIHAVNEGGTRIKNDIDGVLAKLAQVKTDVESADSRTLKQIGSDAGKVSDDVKALITQVESKITQRFGSGSKVIVNDLTRLADDVDGKADALAQAASRRLTRDVTRLATDLDALLDRIRTKIQELETRVAAADTRVVDAIKKEIDKADATLSNVFKVSSAGFVSRNFEFQARLPTLEVTFDPTITHVLTLTDVDTGQVLTGDSDFRNLGVVTDSSGIGTGTRIGAELVRVFLAAIFDAHEGLPAVAPVNAQGVKPTGLTLGEYSLPVFTSPMGNIDSRDLSHMLHTNDQVAAKTRAIMGRIVAGFGPLSLNNPPLEAFVVEIVTTSVREATAKATWCWYACNLDVELKKLQTDAGIVVKAEAKQVEDSVKAKAKKTAEHVKLHIKFSK